MKKAQHASFTILQRLFMVTSPPNFLLRREGCVELLFLRRIKMGARHKKLLIWNE